MIGRIRSWFADPFTGDALVANSEFVSIPREVIPVAPMLPRVQPTPQRRQAARTTHRIGATLVGCAVGLGLLLSGTESMPGLLALLVALAALVAIGLGLISKARRMR